MKIVEIDTREKAIALNVALQKVYMFAVDTETDEIDVTSDPPAVKGKILCATFACDSHTGYYVPAKFVHLMAGCLRNPRVVKAMANSKFDLHMFLHHGIRFDGPIYDILVMDHLYNEEHRHGLKVLAEEYCYIPMREYKDVFSIDQEGKKTKRLLSPQESMAELWTTWVEYATLDAVATYQVAQFLENGLEETEISDDGQTLMDYYLSMEEPMIKVLFAMEREGVHVERDKLKELDTKCREKLLELEKQFFNESKIYGLVYDKPTKKKPHVVRNYMASTAKLSTLFFDILKLKSVKKTKGFVCAACDGKVVTARTNNLCPIHGDQFLKAKNALDAEAIEILTTRHPEISLLSLVREHREMSKFISTYSSGFLELIDTYSPVQSKIYSTYNLHVAVTGRLCIAKDSLIEVVRDVSKYPKCVKIQDIAKGDLVYTYDDSCRFTTRPVLWAGKTGTKKVVRIHWQGDGRHSSGYLDCTPEHTIRLVDGSYKEARLLQCGEKVLSIFRLIGDYLGEDTYSSFMKCVVKIEPLDQEVDVYDIEVEDTHNFIANELCVHNSSTKPNCQNLPNNQKDQGIRPCFTTPKGYCMIVGDYAAIELRVMGIFCQDPTYVEILKDPTRDLHSFVAIKLFNLSCTEKECSVLHKEQRKVAKTVNFGLNYGMVANTLKDRLAMEKIYISYEEAQSYVDGYFTMFPGVKAFIDQQGSLAATGQPIKTLCGRIRRLKHATDFYAPSWLVKHDMNSAANFPIQATASEIIKCGMIRAFENKDLQKMGVKCVMQVHDECMWIVPGNPDGIAKEALPIIVNIMENPFSQPLSVPMKFEAKIGLNWKETH